MKMKEGLIRNMRKSAGLTQSQAAAKLHMSQQHFSRIEKGEYGMDMWDFASFSQIVGQSGDDFSVLYYDSEEYVDYLEYRRINRLIRDNKIDEVRAALPDFEKKTKSNRPMIQQFIALAKVITNEDAPRERLLNELQQAIEMSIENFNEEKIADYRLNYTEILIIYEIALKLFDLNEQERAISILSTTIKGRKSFRATESEKSTALPQLMYALSNFLGMTKRTQEALDVSCEALDMSIKCNNLRSVPGIIYNIACCKDILKLAPPNEIKSLLLEAYYCAKAIRRYELADIIKKDAESTFGIKID